MAAFASSYIKTTTTALTRSADVASMTGTNFSDWFNAAEGTLFANVATFKSTAAGTVFTASLNDNTSSNFIVVGRFSGDDITARVDQSGSVQASLATVGTYVPLQFYKNALAYKVNDFAAVTDGGTVQTDTSGVLPVVDRLSIGALTPVGNQLNGHIQRIAYYPTRLPDATLQALTG